MKEENYLFKQNQSYKISLASHPNLAATIRYNIQTKHLIVLSQYLNQSTQHWNFKWANQGGYIIQNSASSDNLVVNCNKLVNEAPLTVANIKDAQNYIWSIVQVGQNYVFKIKNMDEVLEWDKMATIQENDKIGLSNGLKKRQWKIQKIDV